MRQVISVFILGFMFSMCSTPKPKIEYEEFNSIMNRHADTLLKSYDAKDKEYSLLTFAKGFENHSIIVINKNDTIYKGNLFSDKSMGWAKTFKIDNRFDTKIIEVDSDYLFVIKSKKAKFYKSIYIERSPNNNRLYTITFSNTYRDFY